MKPGSVLRWFLPAMGLCAACLPSVTKDTVETTSPATLAVFAPDAEDPCASELPFPTDLAKNPVTGTLDLPFCSTDTPDQTAIKTGLRTLDGYSLETPIYTHFSAPINATSTSGAVVMLDAQSGQPVPFVAQFNPLDNNLYVVPTAPLKEHTQYIVGIKSAVRDQATGRPVLSDQVFTLLKNPLPLVDKSGYSRFASLTDADANNLELVRQAHGPLFDALGAAGIPRADVLVAWAFTTQSNWSVLGQLAAVAGSTAAEVVHADSIAAADHPLIAMAGIPNDHLCDVHTGRVVVNDLLTDTGTFGVNANGLPLVRRTPIDFLLVTPKSAACTTSWPTTSKVVVFAHGLGRCKNDVLALADTFATAGWAVLSLDGPQAGARSITGLGDQDLDGCPDQLETPDFIGLGTAGANPFAIRDGSREWALELAQVTSVAKSTPWLFAGLQAPAAPTVRVAFVGHSWGGIAATLASSVTPDVETVAVNAASAKLGEVFLSQIQQNVIDQLTAAGVDVTSPVGQVEVAAMTQEAFVAFRWALEPADPYYAAPHYPSGTKVLVQVVTAGGPGVMTDAPLHEQTTQVILAKSFGWDPLATGAKDYFKLTRDNGTTNTPLCTSSTAAVGALLAPCVEKTDPLYAEATLRTAGMQRQIATYVESKGALVCDPVYTVACP